jgi:DNA-binding IclR family transcriptional regulator
MNYLDIRNDALLAQLEANPKGLTLAALAALTRSSYPTTYRLFQYLKKAGLVKILGFEPTKTSPSTLWALR